MTTLVCSFVNVQYSICSIQQICVCLAYCDSSCVFNSWSHRIARRAFFRFLALCRSSVPRAHRRSVVCCPFSASGKYVLSLSHVISLSSFALVCCCSSSSSSISVRIRGGLLCLVSYKREMRFFIR